MALNSIKVKQEKKKKEMENEDPKEFSRVYWNATLW